MLKIKRLGIWNYDGYNHYNLSIYRGNDGVFYIDDVLYDKNRSKAIDEHGDIVFVRRLDEHIPPLYK